MPNSHWTPSLPAADLAAGHPKLWKHDGLQVALFRTEAGEVRAVDNRCPHEGYPLVQGQVKGDTLTCSWHNFKFDLCSGACLMGDEAVRAFPVRVVDGVVELDLTPPDPTAARAKLWQSLTVALSERRQGQLARDTVRLLDAGATPAEIAAFGAAFDADRGEYGPSHAMAVLTDLLVLLRWQAGPPSVAGAASALAQGLDLASEAQVRRPLRPRPPAIDPGADGPARLRAAVEAEDAVTAEGLVRGALAAGVTPAELDRWLLPCLADHFLDFGHWLIYQGKLLELGEQLPGGRPSEGGDPWADAVWGGHVYGIVCGTREDTLPPWSGFRRRVDGLDLAALDARPRAGTFDRRALVECTGAEAVEAVLASDAPAEALFDAIVEAAAERMLRYDLTVEQRVDVQDDWLSVTHRLTVAEAARGAFARWDSPERWKLLLQAAWFVGRAKPLDGPAASLTAVPASDPLLGPDLSDAIAAKEAPRALGLAAHALAAGRPDGVRAALLTLCLQDVAVRPIVVGHLVKTTVAAFREHARTASPAPVLAVVRLFASPVQERRVGRRVYEAVRLHFEGKPPTVLAD